MYPKVTVPQYITSMGLLPKFALKLCPALCQQIQLSGVQRAALSHCQSRITTYIPFKTGFFWISIISICAAPKGTQRLRDISRLTAPQLSVNRLSAPDWTYTHLQGHVGEYFSPASRSQHSPLVYHVRIVFGIADDRHPVPSTVERIGTRSIGRRITSDSTINSLVYSIGGFGTSFELSVRP